MVLKAQSIGRRTSTLRLVHQEGGEFTVSLSEAAKKTIDARQAYTGWDFIFHLLFRERQ